MDFELAGASCTTSRCLERRVDATTAVSGIDPSLKSSKRRDMPVRGEI